jgi:predicted HicB family RNase H-like nuclease
VSFIALEVSVAPEEAAVSESGREMKRNKLRRKPGPAKVYGERFSVRATSEEHKSLVRKAKAAKSESLSRYLVECGLNAPEPPPPVELDPRQREIRERALFELRRAGENLNQVTKRMHVLNLTGRTMSEDELLHAIRALILRVDQMAEAFEWGAE